VIMNSASSKLEVFPNPVRDIINVRLNNKQTATDLNLYDINGRLVMTKKIIGASDLKLDLSGLTGGFYIVTATKGKEVVARTKFVKE